MPAFEAPSNTTLTQSTVTEETERELAEDRISLQDTQQYLIENRNRVNAMSTTTQHGSNHRHGRLTPISVASSDPRISSDEDELPTISLTTASTSRSDQDFPAELSEKSNYRTKSDFGFRTEMPSSSGSLHGNIAKSSRVHHIDISSSDNDGDLDADIDHHKITHKVINNGLCNDASDTRKQCTKAVELDSSSDEDDQIQLGLLQRLQGQKKKFKLTHSTSSQESTTTKSSSFKKGHQIVKEALFGRGGTKPTEHLMSESDDDDGVAMDINNDYSEQTESSLGSVTSSSAAFSMGTDSLDSQTLSISQGSCSSSSASQKRSKRTPEEIEAAKRQALERREEKEQKRSERSRLLEEKKRQKQREVDQRKTIRDAKRAEKPGECMKYMTVVMDPHIIEDPSGAQILAKLQTLECKYAIEAQPFPSCIRWRRTVMETNLLGENIELDTMTSVKQEPEAIVVLPPSDFVEMVHAYKCEQRGEYSTGAHTLCGYVKDVQHQLDEIMPTLVIQSMEKYYRAKKNVHQRQYRNAVLGVGEEEKARGKKRKRKPEDIDILVSRVDVEEALVDLQLRLGCNVRFIETAEQMSDLVGMFTKAVAETPFKRRRDEAKFSFHVHVDWAGGVKVAKDGKGLLKIWRQQFQQFRNVSPEIATAIVTQYASPQILLQAYKKCASEDAAKKLLQDIVVRRGEGVLATSRRVGPELSRRVYQLFTSTDGDLIL